MSMTSKSLPKAVVGKITALTTSALGLIAALAWNNVIQETVNAYIKPLIGGQSGLVSLLIYAVIITVLAVVVTLNLSRLEQKLK